MKKLLLCALVAVSGFASAQFSRDGVRFLSQIPLSDFPGSPTSGAAIYGYTSPSGREYATIGVRNGTAIVEITNPTVPIVRAHIPGPNSLWHENVVLGDYCYSVTEGGGGIQVIDLRNIDFGVATLVATYAGNGLNNIHTIQADPTTNRLFVNGSNRGFLVLDASNPTALVEIGRWTTKYVHDCVIRNFTSGPNAGKQIAYLCCGTAGLYIVDITIPANMGLPQNQKGILNYYPGQNGNFYCHSGSLTPDGRYLMVNDEFDENKSITPSCTTVVVDVSNIDVPVVANRFTSGVNTIDHNSHLRDGFLFLSAYKAGVRVYDARNVPALSEVGYFDSFPSATNSAGYEGDWGVFAGFPSGNIVISDMNSGLFVLDPSEAVGQGAPLTGFSSSKGVATGGVSELRSSDNRYVTVRRTGSYLLDILAETTKSTRNLVNLTIEGKGLGRFDILLRNRSTGQFVNVGSFGLTQVERTISIPNVPAGAFLDSSGQLDIRIQTQGNPLAQTQSLELDMVRAVFHN